MKQDCIEVRGAREHNLKNVSLQIPKHALSVFTGVSGSGKSSLAFDTLYAEGQRRYVESLSSYARQFLGQMEKPKYDSIRGLSPTIAIEQKAASNNPRSTVGTVTEIYDYLRVLFARFGVQHCPQCGRPAEGQTTQQIVDALLELPEGTRVVLLAPVVENRKGDHARVFEQAKENGFQRVHVDGRTLDLSEEEPKLDKKSKHDIAYVVDRLVVQKSARPRITDSVELALKWGEGVLRALVGTTAESRVFSQKRACVHCGISFAELSPQSFSFNAPMGACADCNGLGSRPEMDPELLVPDPEKSIGDGAIAPWAAAITRAEGWKAETVMGVLEELDIPLDVPWKKLPKEQRDAVLTGNRRGKRVWEGLQPQLMRRFLSTTSDDMKAYYLRFLSDKPCGRCGGSRLREEPSSAHRRHDHGATPWWYPRGQGLGRPHAGAQVGARSSPRSTGGSNHLGFPRRGPRLPHAGRGIAAPGGESQRIRLASQIGSSTPACSTSSTRPSISLHQRDNCGYGAAQARSSPTSSVVGGPEDSFAPPISWPTWSRSLSEHGGRVVAQAAGPAGATRNPSPARFSPDAAPSRFPTGAGPATAPSSRWWAPASTI